MPKTPSYRNRTGFAIVTLSDSATKRRRDYWLGKHGSAESRELYHRLVAECEAGGRRLPDKPLTATLVPRPPPLLPADGRENVRVVGE